MFDGSLGIALTPDGNHMTGMGFSLVPEVASLEVNAPSVEPKSTGGGRTCRTRKAGFFLGFILRLTTPADNLLNSSELIT